MKNLRHSPNFWYLRGVLLLTAMTCPLLSAAQENVSFCYNNWPPYAEYSDGKAEGISVRIIQEAGRRLGHNLKFIELPWNDCLQQVRDGVIDAVIDAAKRDGYLQGPASFSLFTDTFWVKDGSSIGRYSDMSGASIGMVDGYSYNSRLLEQIKNLGMTIVYAKDDSTNIGKLSRGEVDTIIADLASTFVLIRQQKIRAYPILPPFSTDQLYLSFNTKKPVLQREFDRVFTELLEKGFVDDVYHQFIGTSYSSFIRPH